MAIKKRFPYKAAFVACNGGCRATADCQYGCVGCELCVNACPMKILKLDDEAVNRKGYHPISITDPDKCIACASCALMCPDGIINVYVEE